MYITSGTVLITYTQGPEVCALQKKKPKYACTYALKYGLRCTDIAEKTFYSQRVFWQKKILLCFTFLNVEIHS